MKGEVSNAFKDWAKNLAKELALLVSDEDLEWVPKKQPQEINLPYGHEVTPHYTIKG
jgi:hypothetical protein